MSTRAYYFAIWALLWTNTLAKTLKATEPIEFCFYSVYQGLSPLTWSNNKNNASESSVHTNGQPSSSLSVHSTKKSETSPCINTIEVTSLYASAKEYCSEKQIVGGIQFWKKMCKHSNSTLMDLTQISAKTSDSYIKGLGKVDPERNKSSEISEPVVLSKSYFNRAYRTNTKKDIFIPDCKTFGWILMAYWGAIVFFGILANLFNQVRFKRHEAVPVDAEGGSPTKSPGTISASCSAILFWLRKHLIIPATIGDYHNQPFYWCTIPKRLELLVLFGFWALTMILSFVKYDIVFEGNISTPNFAQQVWQYSAKRTSVLAYALLPWIWMFAGRNNIFIWATGWSFRTFNIYHRHIARATTFLAIYHGAAYTITYVIYAHEYKTSLEENWFRLGIVALIAMSILVASSNNWVRAKFYDFFLVLHIVLAILVTISLFVHSSNFGNEYDGYLWAIAAIWCFDRFLRVVRVVYCNIHVGFSKKINKGTSAVATYSKETDVIRVDIEPGSSLVKPGPGQSYYLYEPLRFKWWECHPLSLGAYTTSAGTSPIGPSAEKDLAVTTSRPRPSSEYESSTVNHTLTFWIRPYTGWTRRLRDQCLASPSHTINPIILLEGPYGHAAPLHTFDTVVLIVGGTGISTAVPYITEHMKRTTEGRTRTRSIKLVWTARQSAFIQDLCRQELSPAMQRSDFEGLFWASRDEATAGEEKDETLDKAQSQPSIKITQGRPDIQALVGDIARDAEETGRRAVVLACGPGGIADETRAAVHVALKNGCRHLEYVEEAYGW
ncbi:ferric reductase like transmembrane component-domain-containing protein, partial [Phyllosticta capitalensis]